MYSRKSNDNIAGIYEGHFTSLIQIEVLNVESYHMNPAWPATCAVLSLSCEIVMRMFEKDIHGSFTLSHNTWLFFLNGDLRFVA